MITRDFSMMTCIEILLCLFFAGYENVRGGGAVWTIRSQGGRGHLMVVTNVCVIALTSQHLEGN